MRQARDGDGSEVDEGRSVRKGRPWWTGVVLWVLPCALLASLGLLLAHTLEVGIRQRALANATDTTELIARLGIQSNLSAEEVAHGLTPERLDALDADLRTGDLGHGITRVKIWNQELRVVYSDDRSIIGQQFPASDELESALAGRTASEASELTKAENTADQDLGRQLEVYVPLRFDGGPTIGAFEIYMPYAPIGASIADDTRTVYALIVGGLVLLYLALIRIGRDLRRLHRHAAESEFRAMHDPLTGLPNRRLFRDRVERALVQCPDATPPVAVVFVDLDDFKEVNDTLGHTAGDRLLVEVAARLVASVRPGDTVARLGGDEFAILIENVRGHAIADQVCERITGALQTPFMLDRTEVFAHASLGVAVSEHHDVDELLRNADVAMYTAKGAGKECHRFFDANMYAAMVGDRELEDDLRRAIERGEIRVEYQPIVTLDSGQVCGVEALVRWHHPRRGVLQPGDFLALAEATGQIIPVGRWVLEHASGQARSWSEPDTGERPFVLHVNLSARQLQDPGLVDEVTRVLHQTGLKPACLTLEITETAILTDPAAAGDRLRALKDLGVGLAVDDFGTGYSSLVHLRDYPIDTIKIDKSFIDRLGTANSDDRVVHAIVGLAHTLGLRVVAEGIERDEQIAPLLTMGCREGQGYHFARPLDPQHIAALLLHRSITSHRSAEQHDDPATLSDRGCEAGQVQLSAGVDGDRGVGDRRGCGGGLVIQGSPPGLAVGW